MSQSDGRNQLGANQEAKVSLEGTRRPDTSKNDSETLKKRDSQIEKSLNKRKSRNRHKIGESDNGRVRNNPHQEDSINKTAGRGYKCYRNRLNNTRNKRRERETQQR